MELELMRTGYPRPLQGRWMYTKRGKYLKTNMQHEGNYDILFQFFFSNRLDSFVFFHFS